MPSLLVALAAALGATGAATTTKHLLLSPRVVDPAAATAAGAALELGRTTPHAANPLFTDADAGKGRWEGEYSNMWASVYWDRGKYRLWYNSYLNCSGVTPGTGCVGVGGKARANGLEYAESTTGLRWRFPTQRTTAFNGSADNNLQMLITTCGTSVLLDGPDARCALPGGSGNTIPCPYKLVGDLASSAAFAVSADGRTWRHLSGNSSKQQKKPAPIFVHGTHNNVAWAATKQRWIAYVRHANTPVRLEGAVESSGPNFLGGTGGKGWDAPPKIITGLADASQYNTTQDQMDGLVVLEGSTARYDGVYLGLANMMNLTSLTADIELVWSPDLFTWHFVKKGSPLIRRGPAGSVGGDASWAAKTAPHAVGERGDTVRLFYAGQRGKLFARPRTTGLMLATMQRDSWAGYTCKSARSSCQITTRPALSVGASGLRVTFSTQAGSSPSLRLGVVGSTSLSIANCRPLMGSAVAAPVIWKADSTAAALRSIAGKVVAVEMEMEAGMVVFVLEADG